jgi:hypothetical protein
VIGGYGGDDLLVTGYRYVRTPGGTSDSQKLATPEEWQLGPYERTGMSALGSLFGLRWDRADRHQIVIALTTERPTNDRLRTRHFRRKYEAGLNRLGAPPLALLLLGTCLA